LGPPAVGRGPGPAGRFGTPACCRTDRCWPLRTDVPPGTDLAIQAEVHTEPQHRSAGVVSGDLYSRPGVEVPAGFARPRRHAVGEWRRRTPGTRPGRGNGHRWPAPGALAWRPSGLLPRGSRPARPGRARRRCPGRPTSRCPDRQRSASTGRAESRGSGHRRPRRLSLGPPGTSRGQGQAGHVGSSGVHGATSALLRSEETFGIDLAFEFGQERRLALDRCLLRPMLGMHLVGSSAGTKRPLARGHQLMTKLLGRLRGIASVLRHLTRTPLDAWASALATPTDDRGFGRRQVPRSRRTGEVPVETSRPRARRPRLARRRWSARL
jgi:hypothetical protein